VAISIAIQFRARRSRAHGLGLSWNGVVFTPEMIEDSLDERCHVCVDTVGKYRYRYCVFVPKPKPA
jgi:hypothetical protein